MSIWITKANPSRQTLHFNNIKSIDGSSNQSVPIILPITKEDKERCVDPEAQ